VRSYFNNYVYYKWQRSTNGGATWNDVTAPSGPAIPFWNGTAWQYVSSYTVPVSQTQLSNNGDMYRLIVATTLSNLSDINCQFTDVGSIVTLKVIDCGVPLATQLLSFSGSIFNSNAILNWSTTKETEVLFFDIEKSTDASVFSTIATVNSHNDMSSEENFYSFTDPSTLTGRTYYRIRMRNISEESKYSRTIQLAVWTDPFFFVSVSNPFTDRLVFDVAADHSGMAEAMLIDQSGKTVCKKTFAIAAGINSLALDNTGLLATSIYFLRLQSGGVIIQKSVIKKPE
jgi:hypothetical protein